MTVSVHGYPKFKFFLPGTNQLAVGAKLFTYEPGTSTKKTTHQDFDQTTANTNPIVLDANGEASVFLDGKYKLVLAPANDTDPPASPYWTLDDVGDVDVTADLVGVTNKIPNGSFETDADGDGTPDNWTLTAGTGNTLAVDTADNYHGATSMKFTIASANTADIITDFFEVQEGREEVLRWAMKASAADANVILRMKWYTAAQVFVSNSDIYSDSATNPTSWTDKGALFTPPSTARYAKLQVLVATTGKTVNVDNFRTQGNEYYDIPITLAGGIASPLVVEESTSAASYAHFINSTTGDTASDGFTVGIDAVEEALLMNYESTDIYFGTAGTKRGKVGATGNWLISPDGTDLTPSRALTVYKGTSVESYAVFQNSTTGTTASDGFLIGIDASENAILHNLENTDMQFYTNNAFRGKVSAGGNWLISPDGTDITPNRHVVVYEGTSGASYAQFANTTTGTLAGAGLNIGIDGSEQAVFRNYSNTDTIFYTNDTFRGKISAGGEWLVTPGGGDITPTHSLVVYENTSTNAYLQIINSTTGVTSSDGFIIGINSSEEATIYNYENTDMNFWTNGLQEMYLDASDRGLVVGTPTNEGQGVGTVNATDYYINGVRSHQACLAANTGTQAIAAGTVETIDFDNEIYDDNGMHSNIVNSSRMTVPAGATRVRLSANVQVTASSAGSAFRWFFDKNAAGAPPAGASYASGEWDETNHSMTSGIINVSGGDYFQVKIRSVAAKTIDDDYTWFCMEVIE